MKRKGNESPCVLTAWFLLQLFMLFRNHEDLREELERFRPKCPQRGLYSHNSFWMSVFLLPLVFFSVLLAFDKPFSYLQQVAN